MELDSECNRTRFFAYRGAVSINNIGISLLSKGLYCEASRAFKDAVSVLQMTYGTYDEDEVPSIASSVNSMVQKVELAALVAENEVKNMTGIDLLVLVHRQGQSMMLSSLFSHRGPSSVVFPVRIEVDFGYCPSRCQLEVEAALLLHNWATAHILQAQTTSNDKVAAGLRQDAFSIFGLAHKALHVIRARSPSLDSSLMVQSIQLELLVLDGVIPLLPYAGQSVYAELCRGRLRQLLCVVEEIDFQLRMFFHDDGFAAASA